MNDEGVIHPKNIFHMYPHSRWIDKKCSTFQRAIKGVYFRNQNKVGVYTDIGFGNEVSSEDSNLIWSSNEKVEEIVIRLKQQCLDDIQKFPKYMLNPGISKKLLIRIGRTNFFLILFSIKIFKCLISTIVRHY